jgi:hypothetical protein
VEFRWRRSRGRRSRNSSRTRAPPLSSISVSSWLINFCYPAGGINYQFADNKTACMACEPERAKKKKKKDQDNNSSAESPEAEAGRSSLPWGVFRCHGDFFNLFS